MNHNQQIPLTGHSDDDEALFADGPISRWVLADREQLARERPLAERNVAGWQK